MSRLSRQTSHMAKVLGLRWAPWIAILFCGVLGTALPAAFGLARGIPEPVVHDEFSYLLGADTFAHGRLTNRPLRLGEFFEAPHVLVEPTYNSKYPPGQAAFLALGQVLGQPMWGVWLTCGIFAASLCWMLQAWTSRRWALVVTVLSIMSLGTSTYWAQSYWGGMVAASGAALLLGGLRRTLRAPHAVASVLMAAGVALLANSRPYEGLLLSVVPAALLVKWLLRETTVSWKTKLGAWILPFGIVLSCATTFMLAYNRAVTGDAFRAPYSVHVEQYLPRGVFVFDSARQPGRAPVSRVSEFYAGDAFPPPLSDAASLTTVVGTNLLVRLVAGSTAVFGFTLPSPPERAPFCGGLMWLSLLMAVGLNLTPTRLAAVVLVSAASEACLWLMAPLYPLWLLVPVLTGWIVALVVTATTAPWMRFIFASVLVVVLGQSFVVWWMPHYSAPIVPLVLVVVAAVLSRVARLPHAPPAVPLGVLLLALLTTHLATLTVLPGVARLPMFSATTMATARPSRVEWSRPLLERGGRHLVFLSYAPGVSAHLEWVYNGAELEGAPVVYAHDLGAERNVDLIEAFPDRQVWRAAVSRQGTVLEPYPTSGREPSR